MAETSPFFSSPQAQSNVAEKQSPRQRPVAKRRLQREESKAAAPCGICLEAVDDQGFLLRRVPSGVLVPSCTHAYCFTCVVTWAERTNTCPMCKERFTAIRHKCSEKNKTGGRVGPSPVRAGEVVEVEHRDAAANCSSDDEDVAAALAENGSNSEASGDDSDRRVEAWEHGYMVDGFLVRDVSEDEGESGEEAQAWLGLENILRMPAESSPDTTPVRSTQRDSTGSTRNSGGSSSSGSSSSSSRSRSRSSRVARSLGRRSRVPVIRERVGGEIVSSPALGLLAGHGARGRRGSVRRAVMAVAAAERPQGRGRRGGGGAAGTSDDDGDDAEDRLLPNELQQLQREAARLVGDSPLRPRRRPPPPSRLSRYPQRNTANSSSSTRLGRCRISVSSLNNDDEEEEEAEEDDQRQHPRRRLRSSSGAIGASSGASSSRQSRPQQRRQQQSGESDGWCATSSDEEEEEEEEEDEEDEEQSDIEGWTPMRDRSSTASRRTRSERGGDRRGGMSTRTTTSSAATVTEAAPRRAQATSAPVSSRESSSAAASTRSRATRGFGLAAALGSGRRADSSLRPQRAAASQPGEWLSRRSASSAGSGARLSWRPSSSPASSYRPQQPDTAAMPLAGALARAATRVVDTSQRRGGLRSGADSTSDSASAPDDTAAAAASAAATAAAAVAASLASVAAGVARDPSAPDNIAIAVTGAAASAAAGVAARFASSAAALRSGQRGSHGSADSASPDRHGESTRKSAAGATSSKDVDDSDSDMADDIWMEQVPSPSGFAERPRRPAASRQRGGDGRYGVGNGDARSKRETDNQESGEEEEEEEEEEEAEFDWRAGQPPSSFSGDKHGAQKQDSKLRERHYEEEQEEEEELEFDWRVGGNASSPHLPTAAVATDRRGAEGSARGTEDKKDLGGASGRTGRLKGQFHSEAEQQALERSRPSSRLPWRSHNESSARPNKENGAPPKCENDDICSDSDEGCGRKRRRRERGGGGCSSGGRAVSSSSPFFEQFRYTGPST